VRLRSPFLLRTVDPPLSAVFGARVNGVRRIGKRIVLALDGERFVVLHLMIAGRLRWRPPGTKLPGKLGLAAFDFASGSLLLTEASSRQRAALHVRRVSRARGARPGRHRALLADVASFRVRCSASGTRAPSPIHAS
jgi:formamidopyrimidine-DNA glycosylase